MVFGIFVTFGASENEHYVKTEKISVRFKQVQGCLFGGLRYTLTYRYTSWQKLLLLVRHNLLQWSPNELCFLLNILFISSCVTSQMSELVEHVGLGTTKEATTRIIISLLTRKHSFLNFQRILRQG